MKPCAQAVNRGHISKRAHIAITASLTVLPGAARAQSFADPAGAGPIVGAVQWIQGTLMGTVATVAAVIAIAVVGMMMLSGRLNWKYGATVIFGCFILFGAVSIVSGIRSVTAAY